MRKDHYQIAFLLLLIAAFACPGDPQSAVGAQKQLPQLSPKDALLIAEAYHLRESLGDKLWPGWTEVPAPFIYITTEYEYAIGFPRTLIGFEQSGRNELLGKSVQVRKRVFPSTLAASFPWEGVATVAIGTPEAMKRSPGEWVLTAAHEMFHVLQAARGEVQKLAALKLGPETDASWQLNFPFPYADADVMQLIHLQSYPVYLALMDKTESDLKYDAGTAVEAIRVYKSFLQRRSPETAFFSYSESQEWKEGIALYTEYKLAEAAAASGYEPIKGFQQLENYKGYQQLWSEHYKDQIFLVKHAGRAAKSRTAFYHLGLGKGLLLDRLMPGWKTRYFAPETWLNDLLFAALGQPGELVSLKKGQVTPAFRLSSTAGQAVSLEQYRGKVVLLDFWQTWCAPCLEEIPYLKSLAEKYREQGLVVLGITTSGDANEKKKLEEIVRTYGVNYPTLLDEKGVVAGVYNVSGYPHTFILDRSGRLVYDRNGYWSGKEIELEKEIQEALLRVDTQAAGPLEGRTQWQ